MMSRQANSMRRVQLRAIVVEARGRVADLEAHRLERERVVAAQIGLERRRTRASRPRRRRPSRPGRRSRRRSRPRRSCARSGPSARRCCAAVVAKPRRGYASLGVYMLWNETQLRRTLDQDAYIVQQFLGDPRTVADYLATIEAKGIPLHHTFQGPRHSIQALIVPNGTIAHVMSHTHCQRPAPIEVGRAGCRPGTHGKSAPSVRGYLPKPVGGGRSTSSASARRTVGFSFTSSMGDSRAPPSSAGCSGSMRSARRSNGSPADTFLPGVRPPAALEAFESVVGRAADPEDVATLERDGVWRRPR